MMTPALALMLLIDGGVSAAEPKTVEPALVIRAATSIAAMPDRRFIFARSGGRVLVWDALTGSLVASAPGHGGAIDPRTGIAILGAEVWNLEEGVRLVDSGLAEKAVAASGLSQDGRFAVIAGSDILIWDLHEKKLLGKVKSPVKRPSFIALSDSARFVAVGRGEQFDVLEVQYARKAKTGALSAVWPFRTKPSKGFSEFVDDRAVDFSVIYERPEPAGGTRQRPLWRIDWEIGKVNIFADSTPKTGLTAVPRGNEVVVSWAVEGSSRTILIGHEAPVSKVAFSADRWTIATGDLAGKIRLWDAHSGELRALGEGGVGEIISLGFSPDALFLLAGTRSEIRIYAVSP